MELEESTFLTSAYTTKLQSSRQYGTGQRQKYRSMEQNKSSGINPWIPYLWEGKNIQGRKDYLFNRWCWENWSTTCKRMKLEHFLTVYRKINSKWIKDLNVRPETMKLLEENISRTLLYDPLPWVMEIKTKINKWDLVKSFCTTKETISKVKR